MDLHAAYPCAPAVVDDTIVRNLQRPQACIDPKYFYDDTGSALFEAITRLPEYYLTRAEQEIFDAFGDDIAREVGGGTILIEPGAGNCRKAAALCRVLQPRCVVAHDISALCLTHGVARLQAEFPEIEVHAVVGDLTDRIVLPDGLPTTDRLVFFPGSTIGNFDPGDAYVLLSRIRNLLSDDGMLLRGVHLQKETTLLEAAYNDAFGTTAAFNRNILTHVNRLIRSDFKVDRWLHQAHYNVNASRIEMHLEASTRIDVRWSGGGRLFFPGERIHTENSYKYRPLVFGDLLARAGLPNIAWWTDCEARFGVFLARP